MIQKRQEDKSKNPRSCVVNNLLRGFGKIGRRAGIKNCNPHDLRRSAITNWAQKLPIQIVQ
jgi:integrase